MFPPHLYGRIFYCGEGERFIFNEKEQGHSPYLDGLSGSRNIQILELILPSHLLFSFIV